VTLDRDGVAEPAVQNMPFVAGDRLRTAAGRAEIVFPDGSGLEVGEYSEVEAVSATRVRLLSGTMDHLQRPAAANSPSASYLPADLRTYGNTFDQYGSWQYDAPYGYVWYPSVGPDWRPYYYGSWSPIRSYGWTWVGLDAWAWPTHHYGRWGFARNAWFWIPGRTWGAAWVSWSFSNDYVSWCPLGYDSRPVFAVAVGSRRVWDRWNVPRSSFGARGSYVGRYAERVRGRESGVGSRGSIVGNRERRPSTDIRASADERTTTGYRRPSVDSRSATDDRSPAAGYRRPSVDSRSTTDYRRPTTDSRPTADYRRPTTDSRPTTDYRRPTTDSRPTADYRRPTIDSRPTTDYRRPTPDSRPTTDYRRPTTDYRRPTTDAQRREAPAASVAPTPRAVPHERAAPSGGDARPRAQERPAQEQGHGRRR
jgi:hypothetical protein